MKFTIIFIIVIFLFTDQMFGQGISDDEKLIELISNGTERDSKIVMLENNEGVFEQIIEMKELCANANLSELKNSPESNKFAQNACIKFDSIFLETFTSHNIEFLKSQINLGQKNNFKQKRNSSEKIKTLFITKPIYNFSGNVAFVCITRPMSFFTGIYIKEDLDWKQVGILYCGIY